MLLFMLVTVVIAGQMLLIFGLGERISWLLSEANEYRPAYRVATFGLAISATIGLFRLRKNHRGWYGVLELLIAALALSVFVGRNAPASFPEWLAGFAGPIYIAIRGLDNMDQAASAAWHNEPERRRPLAWLFGG